MLQRLSELWRSGPGGKVSVLISAGTFIAVCCMCGVILVASVPRSTREATVPTYTLPPLDTPLPTSELQGGTVADSLEFPLIPGLSVVDMTFNLEDAEAECSGPNELNGRYTTSCSKDEPNI